MQIRFMLKNKMLFNSTKAIVFFALIDSNLFNKQVLYTTLQYY